MQESGNIYSYDWCEIVFEEKNKEYGAYDLRLHSSKRHVKALVIAIVFFTLAILSPIIIKSVMPEKKEAMTEVTSLLDVKMDKPKDQENKVIENTPPPELKSSIKFTPPVIRPDEEVTEEMKSQEELTKTDVSISIADVKGNDDGTGVDISELNQNTTIADEAVAAEVFTVVEQMPEFPGGQEDLYKYLGENIKYPEIAKQSGISGRVFVSFVVEPNGSVSNIKILRGIGGGCDEEAVRVIKGMPKWKSGKQNGKPVRVSFNLPVNFQLQ
ncbi:MAG: TonB family protein [Bacteroidota bacterium]